MYLRCTYVLRTRDLRIPCIFFVILSIKIKMEWLFPVRFSMIVGVFFDVSRSEVTIYCEQSGNFAYLQAVVLGVWFLPNLASHLPNRKSSKSPAS